MITLVEEKLAPLRMLCAKYGVRRLELIGSASRGSDFIDLSSDVDFVVEFGPLPEGSRADSYFGLLEDLQELLERPVDLVVRGAIRNPYFAEAVEAESELLYAA
jgi:uncharacterized protein